MALAAPKVLAEFATVMRRIMTPTARIAATSEAMKTKSTAATNHVATSARTTSTTDMPTDAMTMVRSTDQSDIRPPIVLPTIPPRPKAKSATGTNRSGCPATSVMSGATYEYIANMPPKPIDPR